MTMIPQSVVLPRPRNFPSKLALVAALELLAIAILLRLSNTQGFFPAAMACSLGAVQLGMLLIHRFTRDTRNVRRMARSAEFSNQAVFITDPTGRIKWTNPRFTRLTGYGLAEVVGKTFAIVLHGQETDTREVEKVRDRLRQQLPFETELLQYDRVGLSHWVSSKGQPIFDAQGQTSHYMITQIDVTDERRQSRAIIDELTRPVDISSEKVNQLTRQLQSLADLDERDQLEAAVLGLQKSVADCIGVVPAEKLAPQMEASYLNSRMKND
jgi:PAS domain S-box-containing protein